MATTKARAQHQSEGHSPRGFGAMDPERQRAISAAGGRAAHEKGTAHEFDSEQAREAGRKGGQHSHGGHASRAQHAEAGRQSHKNQ